MKLRILFFGLLYVNFAFSQKNFRDGFIILKDSKDTIKGKIDDKNWLYNPITINFLGKEININDLKAFGIYNKEYYEIKTVNLDITPFQSGTLLTNPQRIIKYDTLIALMILLKAEHQLSYFSDKLGKDHFFYENNDEVLELVNHKFLQSTKNGNYEIENKLFQKQLDTLFRKCTQNLKINSLSYTAKSLINIFTDFNDCMGCSSTCYFKSQVDKNQSSFHLVPSISLNSFNQRILEKDNLVLDRKSNNTKFSMGLAFILTSRRSKGSNNLYSEMSFSMNSIENNYYKANFPELAWANVYRKNVLNYPKFKPFFGLGLGLNFLYSNGIEFTSLTTSNGEWYYLDFTKLTFDGISEVGFNMNKINLFCRFKVKLLNPSAYHTLLLHQNKIDFNRFSSQFGFSYQLFKNNIE
jgi:hypothetical protein